MVLAITVFLSIGGAVVSRLLADEIKAWIPWMVEQFIHRAVLHLPPNHRDRYDEEWRGHVQERPGDIGRLICSIQLWVGAGKITALLQNSRKSGEQANLASDVSGISLLFILNAINFVWKTPLKSLNAIIETLSYVNGKWIYEGLEYELFDKALGDNEQRSIEIRMPSTVSDISANALLEFTWHAISFNVVRRRSITVDEDSESEKVVFYDLTATGRCVLKLLQGVEKVVCIRTWFRYLR